MPLRWRRRLAVLVGGMAGGAARIGVSHLVDSGDAFPWATLGVNLTGAFLLGYLLTRYLQAASSTALTIPLVCTGVLGSYTTFSTFALETWELVEDGRATLGLAYVGVSVAAGLLLAATGIRLAEGQ